MTWDNLSFVASEPRDTSRAAKESIDADTLRSLTYDEILAFGPTGLTADEIAKRLSVDKLSIRPRVSELVKRGLVVDSGERRQNRSGRSAKVWIGSNYQLTELKQWSLF